MNDKDDKLNDLVAGIISFALAGPIFWWGFGDIIVENIKLITGVILTVIVLLVIGLYVRNFIFCIVMIAGLGVCGASVYALVERDSLLLFYMIIIPGLYVLSLGGQCYTPPESDMVKKVKTYTAPIPFRGELCDTQYADIKMVVAPFDCEVAFVRVKKCSLVEEGERLLIVEDNCWKYEINAPCKGYITKVMASSSTVFRKGESMVELRLR